MDGLLKLLFEMLLFYYSWRKVSGCKIAQVALGWIKCLLGQLMLLHIQMGSFYFTFFFVYSYFYFFCV